MILHRRRRARAAILCACCAWLVPARAVAQDRRWEIEVYGGFASAPIQSAGSRTLPAAGTPIVTSSPIFPSRETPSWFFGDGAALLNAVNTDFGNTARIAPLDSAFGPLEFPSAPAFGARLRRRMGRRLSLEASVDAFARSGRADAVPAIVEASRASFAPAFLSLLGTGPFSGIAVDATATTVAARRREMAFTAAANADLPAWGSIVPYITVGGGILAGSGDLPSATLAGRYRFAVLGEVPIDETDHVTLRYTSGKSFVAVLGAGVRRSIAGSWGLRIDARVLVGPGGTRVLLDARPSSVVATPAGFVESFTTPAIQFSNDPSTGRRSSLSAPALQAFETFSGGVRARPIVTVGLCRRF